MPATTHMVSPTQKQSGTTYLWRRYSAWVILPLVVLLLLTTSLAWLQWAGQEGIQLGYPKPTVSIQPLANQTVRDGQNIRLASHATGRDLKYQWSFDDADTNGGGQSTVSPDQSTVQHAYTSNGQHSVSVTVTDGIGQSSTTSLTISVLPVPPKAEFTSQVNSDGFDPAYVSFDASNTIVDSTDSISSYTWDFGDGSQPQQSYGSSTSYNYPKSGVYKVTLTVVDQYNQQSSYSSTVTVSSSSYSY